MTAEVRGQVTAVKKDAAKIVRQQKSRREVIAPAS